MPQKKSKIIKKTREWAKILCCNEIDLHVVFKRFSKNEKADDGDFETIGYTTSNSRYLESTIYWNTDKLRLINDETIVHELLHIKLNELTGYLYANEEKAKADQWKGYFEERFVSQLAKIITRL